MERLKRKSLSRSLKVTTLGLFGASALMLSAHAQSNAPSSNASLVSMQKNANDWVMPTGTYNNWRYSPLKQINTSNAKNLQVAWSMSTGTDRGLEGQPIVIGNMMYFETSYPNYVYAIDLNHPDQIAWKYSPPHDSNAPPVACCDVVNRGPAYADGMVYANALDGVLYALDAKTGKVVWQAKNAHPQKGQTMTGAPMVVGDNVITGVAGGEYGVRGYLTAYNAKTGKQVWRAYSEGPNKDMLMSATHTINGATGKPIGPHSSLKTWQGNEWKVGGGTTWGWFSYDPKLNLLYYGTGNPGTWNPSQRPGKNRWSMTIMARNPETGEAKWVYQMTPHDGWDYDGVNEMVLVNVDDKGKEVPALVHFDRNGFSYVMNRETGAPIAIHKYDPSVNWATGINPKTNEPIVDPAKMTGNNKDVKDICPASQGDKDEQPVSYDPQTKLFYAPLNHLCMSYQAFNVKYKAGFPFVGAIVNMIPGPGGYRGRFIAYNPMTGKTIWQHHDMFQDWGGAMTTGGGLAFYGTLKGMFRVVDAKTGKMLYQFKTPSGIIGNPITYMHDGKQYVAILSGVGGWAAIGMADNLHKASAGLGAVGLNATLTDYTNLGGTLMVFALPSKVASAN
ncbi:methanol/ethanol family PQQ-dependent dehydrogenase [Acidiphilium acidophilum]|uniref:Methanol/ethanol family PQQ-dependent dehydrogenase n=1 Tax=Acidiphilium acidophilum TaxID=76588 RepID=A0AAW9DTQ9_ACIAO|nr:methanol/ethanol family PQQ-dependent dehydrogenase [Acidiphilium acidophilum]MDX5932443.1 methanol/ethanol family PQQ-dependent dehydrogenase [Acidiphilium acidophilum]GBR73818.1 methanol dehydrogenase subunit 1 [Acidiphilium acidophilum DSM 700]